MIDPSGLPRDLLPIYNTGTALAAEITQHFQSRPTDENGRRLSLQDGSIQSVDELREQLHRWFNMVSIYVLPFTTYEKAYVNKLLRRIDAAIRGKQYHEQYLHRGFHSSESYLMHDVEDVTTTADAEFDATQAFETALRMVRTVPATTAQISPQSKPLPSSVANTAFILMWMDPHRPELVDVHETVRSVFAEFGVRAIRADDVEHQETITEIVLDNIAKAEFLIADLSGERPNVYYEIGYAHALGKRPILFRRTGTPLHFDLSVHNVPEYSNLSELRDLLRKRLIAITGRDPTSGRG